MYNLTPEQKKTIETATESLSRDIDLLIDQIKKEGDIERRKILTANLAALVVQRIATERDLQQRFKEDQLRALGDPELIIKDACAVADYEIAVLFKELTTTAEAITEDAQRDAVAFFMDPACDEPKLNAEKVFVYLTEFCDAFEAGCEALAPHFQLIENIWPSEKDSLENAVKDAILANPHIAPEYPEQIKELSLAVRRPFIIKPPNNYAYLSAMAVKKILKPAGGESSTESEIEKLWKVNIAAENEPLEIPVFISLQYPKQEGLKDFNAFDKAVIDAISTLCFYSRKAGNEYLYITPAALWRFMTGRDMANNNLKPSAQQLQRLNNSIEKSTRIRLNLDFSNEIKAKRIKLDGELLKNGYIKSSMLEANTLYSINEEGKETPRLYRFKEPALSVYSEGNNGKTLVEYKYLDITEAGYEGNSLEIRDYLLGQIELLTKGKRSNRKIKFDTLYKDTGLTPPAERVDRDKHKTDGSYLTAIKKESAKDRKKILAILDIWKSKGFIKNYRLVKEGYAFSGVEIKPSDRIEEGQGKEKKKGTKNGKVGTKNGKMGTKRKK